MDNFWIFFISVNVNKIIIIHGVKIFESVILDPT
jgi:hypothetical protein